MIHQTHYLLQSIKTQEQIHKRMLHTMQTSMLQKKKWCIKRVGKFYKEDNANISQGFYGMNSNLLDLQNKKTNKQNLKI